jgi:hypothetical protein
MARLLAGRYIIVYAFFKSMELINKLVSSSALRADLFPRILNLGSEKSESSRSGRALELEDISLSEVWNGDHENQKITR